MRVYSSGCLLHEGAVFSCTGHWQMHACMIAAELQIGVVKLRSCQLHAQTLQQEHTSTPDYMFKTLLQYKAKRVSSILGRLHGL